MPKIEYATTNFRPKALEKIGKANEIIREYRAQGLDLTLRQLYYQFVSRGLIANNEREYKNLGEVISNGRMAGLIDWNSIVDRTRYLRALPHWDHPTDIVNACASQFRLDKWENQPEYVEVWIEKDALVGVIEGVCNQNDVPYYAARGYSSASETWAAGYNRLRPKIANGKHVTILYLGDHDPSGIDMTRDVRDRLHTFAEADDGDIDVRRLALNMDQVEQYNPPPNPTKMTDSRAGDYLALHGDESWELDALEPTVIRDLIGDEISGLRDDAQWERDEAKESRHRSELAAVAKDWTAVLKSLKKGRGE